MGSSTEFGKPRQQEVWLLTKLGQELYQPSGSVVTRTWSVVSLRPCTASLL